MAQELYELPEGWEWREFESLTLCQSGSGFSKTHQGKEGQEIPFLKVSDMNLLGNETEIVLWNNSVSRELASQIKAKLMPKGTVIFPKIGAAIATNKKRILTCDSAYDNNVMGLKANDELLDDFLFWFTQSVDLSDWASNSALPSMKATTVKAYQMPLPPLAEQERIVGKLDALFSRIDQAIDQLKHSQSQTKALFASARSSAVSDITKKWPRHNLSELGEFSGGGTPSKSNKDFWDGSILWITPKDMKSPNLSDSKMKITEEAVDHSSAKMIPPHSVLIVARSGILRHTLPVCLNTVETTVNQDIKVFIPNSKITASYCQHMLKGHESMILNDLVKGGVTVESLKYKEFQNYPFPTPPLAEQQKIIAYLDALSARTKALEAATAEQLSRLTALKSSLLDTAFKGKL